MRKPWGLYRVVGRSMAPDLAPGDLLGVSGWRPIRVGSVVVVESPDGLVMVKRTVAAPGSTVALGDDVLTVDGVVWPSVLGIPGGGRWEVPDAHWFVLSDAPDRTMADSRSFGPRPESAIRGVVVARLWPPRSGRVG